MLVGQGGEAEVYDLGDGRVLKWWKPASHPDYAGDAAAAAAATRRIAEHQRKLRAFPAGLPAAVIAPGAVRDREEDARRTSSGSRCARSPASRCTTSARSSGGAIAAIELDTVVAALRELHDGRRPACTQVES